ncbi:MAG: cytochrome c1 [Gammaproteobacteria bacterium]|jgi:ubiquinol-cytochrome c reductase cytochrome c1 subunit|nr:cytochrome c1 [Gammaproteobacteria bacterium]
MNRSLHPGLAAVAGLLACLVLGTASAAGAGGGLHDAANNDIGNLPSLQRGAGNFVNYCMGCHSAKYVRYNQLVRDLQIPEELVVKNLMFAAVKPTETMEIAMHPEDAQRWFGLMPPDLSLIARSKGPDYLYNFLRSFYLDPSRFTGVNNLNLPGASMPHVLAELQGTQQAIFREAEVNGTVQHVFDRFEQVTPGTMTAAEYDEFVRDTVNFLDYIGEPVKQKRQSLGILVMAFLLVFLVLAWLLKREVWRDVR